MTPKELRNLTKSLKVLYVEDDQPLREATSKMFMQFFGSMDEAEDGEAGWALYQKNDYDIVITDINMPKMNGVEMLKLIKQKYPMQAAIVTSAYNDADSLLSLIDLGVDKFLLKPMDFKKVLDCLVHTALYVQNIKSNFEYANKIAELEAEVLSLKQKLNPHENVPTSTPETTQQKLSQEDSILLDALEKKLSKAIYDIQMQGDYPDHLKENVLSALDKYAQIIYEDYQELSIQLNKLDQSIEKDELKFQSDINYHCSMLEDVSSNLKRARKASFNEEHTSQLLKSMKRIMAALRP